MSYGEELVERYIKVITDEPYVRNHRPWWLNGLELDFYFPRKRIAIEFQGDHHYQKTEYSQNLKAVRYRDRIKRRLCEANDVHLIRLDVIDLWWCRFRRKTKAVRFFRRRTGRPPGVSEIDRDAARYRKYLKKRFDSISSVRPSHWKRNKARAKIRETIHLINVIGGRSAEESFCPPL